MGYDGSLKFDTEISEKGFNSGVKKLGSIAKGGLAVIGGAATGVATAFGVMTKKALDSYASLEQNIGGVETLFKNSSQSVIDNAKRAYKAAGLSANAYMETVTSFSASLLQSLGNDTKKAAEYADSAIIDMSDNANKMGTSMELIQNAYQGFAKQNYSMLDNLKLGYGGTSSEMYRLLQDAAKLNEEFANTAQFSMDSKGHLEANFADITKAIHIVQTEMGITGTTAQEASETISGSVSAMKGAFDNFLNGTGSPKELAETMVTAGKNVINGLSEIVPRLLETLPEVKNLIQENLAQAFSGDTVQRMVESGKNVVMSLLTGMLNSVSNILPVALSLIQYIAEAITTNVPILLQKGYEILQNLINGFVEAIPEALPKILDFIQGIGDKLAEAAPVMIQKGFELLQKLVEGIVTAIPILVSRVPEIISTFANVINDNFPTILAKGVQLIGQLVMGIIQAIPTIIANIPKIISAIVDTIMAFQWLSLGKNIITFFKDGIMSMVGAVKSAGTNVFNAIKNAIVNLPSTLGNLGRSAIHNLSSTIRGLASSAKTAALKVASAVELAILKLPQKMLSIGKNIVKGLWNGISNMTGWIADKVMGFANSVLGGIKKALGIHSPSRVMRDEVGKMMALGMGIGFEKNIPVDDMQKSLNDPLKKIKRTALDVTMRPAKSIEQVTYEDKINTAHLTNSEQKDFDYERIGNEIKRGTKEGMEGMGIYLNEEKVGEVITPSVNNNMGIIERRRR
jgi:phage-related protein